MNNVSSIAAWYALVFIGLFLFFDWLDKDLKR